MFGAGDVRVVTVPDPMIRQSTDAIVRVVAGSICGSDLWPYASMAPRADGARMGHEFVGVVEAVGAEVVGIAEGDFVVAPFLISDGTCDFCRQGLQSSCRHGAQWGSPGVDGGQGERVRVPFASGTLVPVPAGFDEALVPSLTALSDVMSTGYHAAVSASVSPGTSVTVIGDGAVGLCAVIAARLLGAERVILMGRHRERTDLGRDLGATDVIAERGAAGVAAQRALTNGDGTHVVIEAVGLAPALQTAVGTVRDGGVVSRVGVPQGEGSPFGFSEFVRNVRLTGGLAPARAYIPELLPHVLDGSIEPGRVFDRTTDLDGAPDGYRAMAERTALKVLIRP
jgi:threonine dehydrogenase-like Zn-dependent dehydrogenase